MDVVFRVKANNNFGTISFSENLLGIIEAALALARWENIAFVVDEVNLFVNIDELGSNPPKFDLDRPPNPGGYKLIWKPDMVSWLYKNGRKEVGGYLMQFLLKLLFDITIDPMDDLKKEFDHWNESDTFIRAIGTSP